MKMAHTKQWPPRGGHSLWLWLLVDVPGLLARSPLNFSGCYSSLRVLS